MIADLRPAWPALLTLALALAATGCKNEAEDTPTSGTPAAPATGGPAPTVASPESDPHPTRVGETAPTATLPEIEPKEKGSAPAKSDAPAPAPAPEEKEQKGDAKGVTLEKVNYDELLRRIAANKDAKLTMVDAWATWCGPCKENFPHVVEMNKKYAGKGLAVVSLSLDDPTESKQVEDARAFLGEKKAEFTNFLLDEEQGAAFDKLKTNTIPAVFLFGPDGKEIKRFTYDDPNNQFTYDEVEKTVVALLEGKPLPK